jgi:hypothetical protein
MVLTTEEKQEMHATIDATAVQSLHACYLLLLFIPYNDWGVMSTPHNVVAVSMHACVVAVNA